MMGQLLKFEIVFANFFSALTVHFILRWDVNFKHHNSHKLKPKNKVHDKQTFIENNKTKVRLFFYVSQDFYSFALFVFFSHESKSFPALIQ